MLTALKLLAYHLGFIDFVHTKKTDYLRIGKKWGRA